LHYLRRAQQHLRTAQQHLRRVKQHLHISSHCMLSQDLQLEACIKLAGWTNNGRGQGAANKWAGNSHGMISFPTHYCCTLCTQLDMHGPCHFVAALKMLSFCLQGWLLHKDIQLAAYFPFFREAGIDKIEVRHTHFWHPKAVLHASRAAMLCKHYIGPFISKPLTTPFLCLPFVLLKPKPACGYPTASHSCNQRF